MEIPAIVDLYVQGLQYALPIAITFWACDLITGMILRAAFGGKLLFRGSV